MISRRRFVQSSLTVALVPMLPRVSMAATTATRPNWTDFAKGPQFKPFVDAIGKMRANKDNTDPNGWYYWVKVHEDHCPHGKPYFLAWHRGLLKRFEGELRRLSGVSDLVLPYWDYYTEPQIPPEFQDSSSPLWRGDRVSNDVTNALSLAPFDDTVVNFPRGYTNAFEPALESAPHNPVHNIIGGAMANVRFSPADPIFYVHHANIDRLWAAWVKAGNGRQMPPVSDSYWDGSLNYGPAIKAMPTRWTYSTTSTYLNYVYADESMPQSLPGSYMTAMLRPASQPVTTLAPTRISANRTSLGGAGPFVLDENSTTVDVPLDTQGANQVRSTMLAPSTTSTAGAPLDIVLDGLRLTGLGETGGYFYKVMLNLPVAGQPVLQERSYMLGMIGPFEITAAAMRMRMALGLPMDGSGGNGGKLPALRFPITEALRKIWPISLDKVSVSFVRVDGSKRRRGRTILVNQLRLEAAG